MTARAGAAAIRSSASSPRDLPSASTMAIPRSAAFGARTGRESARRPSSRAISWQWSEVSVRSTSSASTTTLCSSGPSAPSLSHSTFP